MRVLALTLAALLALRVSAAPPAFDEAVAGSTQTAATFDFDSAASVADDSYATGALRVNSASDLYNDDCDLSVAGTFWNIGEEIGHTLYVLGRANIDGGGGTVNAGSCTFTSTTTTRGFWAVYTGAPTSSELDGAVLTGTFTDQTSVAATAKTITMTDVTVICWLSLGTGQSGDIASNNGETERQEYNARLQLQDISYTNGGSHACSWTWPDTSTGAWGVIALKSTTSTAVTEGASRPLSGALGGPIGGPIS